jgi:uncharacterized protein (DUF433 family)
MATETTKKQSWVQKTTGVCGGRACIRNTRITVWGLVNSRRLGATDEQILENVVGVTPEDLQAAWDYYHEYPAEIDEDIHDNEAD